MSSTTGVDDTVRRPLADQPLDALGHRGSVASGIVTGMSEDNRRLGLRRGTVRINCL